MLKEDIKKRAVKLKGSCCNLCGYKTSLKALHFHHINPHEKDFNISEATDWQRVEQELSKCVLVCANCHVEIHEGFVSPEVLVEFSQF